MYSVLQGMGSLHCQHLESLSAFTGGIGSVALRSGESFMGLFLQCCELHCTYTGTEINFLCYLDIKLTIPVNFHPVFSLSLAYVVLASCLVFAWLFGKCDNVYEFSGLLSGLKNGRLVHLIP